MHAMRPDPRVTILCAALLAAAVSGCDVDDDDCCSPDYRAPHTPQGLWTETGDQEVELHWLANPESDLDGYSVYRGREARGYFRRVADLGRSRTSFVDRDVENGVTYYYAISAQDDDGNESELSPEEVFDTPRPEGFSLRLRNARVEPARSGYDFSERDVLDFHELEADVYFWATAKDGAWMVATERSDEEFSDIQDAGFIALESVDWAPDDGWAPHGEVPLVRGHSYVVWTWDNHYAKFRVNEVSESQVTLDWAYQIDRGNPELAVPGSLSGFHKPKTSRVHSVGEAR